MVSNDKLPEQKAVLNPFIQNIKHFSVFSTDCALCVLLMPCWLRALLAGLADGIQQREFPLAGACKAISVKLLSGVLWVV